MTQRYLRFFFFFFFFQQKPLISEAHITTVLHLSRENKDIFKHGIMTTITEECQLVFYNYKMLEKAEIQRGENIERKGEA